MNYSDFHLYTVAKGERFIEAAQRCAVSFTEKCPGLKFTIFCLNEYGLGKIGRNINVQNVDCPKYFTAALLMRKPCADILFFKYADAPFMLDTDAKYVGQVDADCLCMCKLPFEYFIEDLDNGFFCAASDPKCEVNKREIDNKWPGSINWKLYFNSGVCFWANIYVNEIFRNYKKWVLKHIDKLAKLQYADQTWLNIAINDGSARDMLSEIGWYWNFRGTVRHPRAYIWHAGGRDSNGIEVLKKEFESWQK